MTDDSDHAEENEKARISLGEDVESANSDSGNEMVQLMELLAHEAVTWEEVEDLLHDFPGWLRVVRVQREPMPNTATRTIYFGSPLQFDILTAQKRKHLAEIFRPFAVLLDRRLSAGERAVRLQTEAGVEAARFCREHLHDGSPRVAQAAAEVLAATRQQKTLLRQSSSSTASPDRLLRPARPDNGNASQLLQPSEDAKPPAISPDPHSKPTLWQRLFGR